MTSYSCAKYAVSPLQSKLPPAAAPLPAALAQYVGAPLPYVPVNNAQFYAQPAVPLFGNNMLGNMLAATMFQTLFALNNPWHFQQIPQPVEIVPNVNQVVIEEITEEEAEEIRQPQAETANEAVEQMTESSPMNKTKKDRKRKGYELDDN